MCTVNMTSPKEHFPVTLSSAPMKTHQPHNTTGKGVGTGDGVKPSTKAQERFGWVVDVKKRKPRGK